MRVGAVREASDYGVPSEEVGSRDAAEEREGVPEVGGGGGGGEGEESANGDGVGG